LDKANSLGAGISNCVVIDDSASVCKVFEGVGGRAVRSFGVEEVVGSLEMLKVENV
jgi:hypothetical protein